MWTIEKNLAIKIAFISMQDICISKSKEGFRLLEECAFVYRTKHKNTPLREIEGIRVTRRLFHAIGLDPTKHRPASEALLNRVLKNKQIYSVNSIVDVGNWCALDFLMPTCEFDKDKIKGDVIQRKGKENESYIGLNNRIVHLANRYALYDEKGAFGSPLTDSKRTSITSNTANVILIIYAPGDYDSGILNQQAKLFSKRIQAICKGVVKEISVIP